MFPFAICNFIIYRHSARVILACGARSRLVDERSCLGCRQFLGVDFLRPVIRRFFAMKPSIKSLQATRDGGSSSASRFTSFGPACLSAGR